MNRERENIYYLKKNKCREQWIYILTQIIIQCERIQQERNVFCSFFPFRYVSIFLLFLFHLPLFFFWICRWQLVGYAVCRVFGCEHQQRFTKLHWQPPHCWSLRYWLPHRCCFYWARHHRSYPKIATQKATLIVYQHAPYRQRPSAIWLHVARQRLAYRHVRIGNKIRVGILSRSPARQKAV